MAPVNPPTWQQAGSYNARLDRLAMAGMMSSSPGRGPLGGRTGVKPSPQETGFRVTQRTTPDRWVTVHPGTAWIHSTSATGGLYEVHNDAEHDILTADAHATLDRIDLIVAQVLDSFDDAGTDDEFVITAVQGTPAASPVAPAAPSQSIILAEILVAAASLTVTDADITDTRDMTVALGGMIPVLGIGQRPNPTFAGQRTFLLGSDVEDTWNGSAWLSQDLGAWPFYTPTLTAFTADPSLGNGGILHGRFCRVGRAVHVVGGFKYGDTGVNVGDSFYYISLPFTAAMPPAGRPTGTCLLQDVSPANTEAGICQVENDGTRVSFVVNGSVVTDDSPWVWAPGDELTFSITYQAA